MKEEFYNKIIEWTQNIGNLATEEIPSFIKEVASYGFYSEAIASAGWSILTFTTVIFASKFFCKASQYVYESKYDTNPWWVTFVICCILIFLFFTASVCCLCDAIKAKISPRLYVIERLMKNK